MKKELSKNKKFEASQELIEMAISIRMKKAFDDINEITKYLSDRKMFDEAYRNLNTMNELTIQTQLRCPIYDQHYDLFHKAKVLLEKAMNIMSFNAVLPHAEPAEFQSVKEMKLFARRFITTGDQERHQNEITKLYMKLESKE